MTATRDDDGGSYSLGAVVRLTGLSEHTIRAWERRYGAVRPARSPKGTRRYRQGEVARLRLLRDAVESGHRIGDIAELSDHQLETRLALVPELPHHPLEDVIAALDRLDLLDVERLLGLQLGALGPVAFCSEVAHPLLVSVGSRWEHGEGTVAAEHLLSSTTRGMLGMALRAAPAREDAPRLVFTTPEGERHELGALMAAVSAVGAGAAVTYLGPELPVEEVVGACAKRAASAVGLSVVTLPGDAARGYLEQLRSALPAQTEVWIGGSGSEGIGAIAGVEPLPLDDLPRALARIERRP